MLICVLSWIGPRFDRIGPGKAGKSAKASISGMQDASVFNCQGCQLSIGCQWSTGLTGNQQLPKNAPLLVPRRKQQDVRLFQPLVDHLDSLIKSESFPWYSGISCDPDEGSDSLPGQTYDYLF